MKKKKTRKVIHHVSGIKFTISIEGDPLSVEDIDFIKTLADEIYFNDLECYHWMFDARLPSGRFLENIKFTNSLKNAHALVL